MIITKTTANSSALQDYHIVEVQNENLLQLDCQTLTISGFKQMITVLGGAYATSLLQVINAQLKTFFMVAIKLLSYPQAATV